MTNLFYKLPADILQADVFQKAKQEKDALSLMGLTFLIWISIQESREKKVSKSYLENLFRNYSSHRQRQFVLDSKLFVYDAQTDTYSLSDEVPYTRTQPRMQPHTQSGGQPRSQPGVQPGGQPQVPLMKELDKDIEKEVEENTRETTTPTTISFSSLILELKSMTPTQGELWEGVLLYCPDQSLRTVMTEHWYMTVDFIEKHLRASGMIAQVKDMKTLCDAMRDLFQPSNPAFGGLKLFLEQEAKPDIEKAFDQWIAKQSNILLMQEPLSFLQFCDLVKMGFDARTVRYTVERLNNYPSTPRKYVSAFHTVRDWLCNPNYK